MSFFIAWIRSTAPRPAVTANAPMWSGSPVSVGATKSPSERFGTPSRCSPCWRRLWSVVRTSVRSSSV